VLKDARISGAPSGAVLQVYVDGKLVHTSTGQENKDLAPGELVFLVDSVLDGDVLIRIRVEEDKGKPKVSLFRAALHTGYTPSGTWRMNPSDLDGGKDGCWMELHFDARGGALATSPARLTKVG